ncbi:MAG TPA: sigma-70 family RNA polymerase sigma factor [Oligoflexia bacterium]|nr:sigma-70 family RNA polymerase sigma factor [Oligoflexia bacterium]HMP26748.1 sigma-70 family RNA polymerase sigma factor [Oligoflexia bacterium]
MKNIQSVTDLVLVKAARQGSQQAFAEIVSRYETKVYQLAIRLTKNPEDAEEVVQDVFTILYKKLGSFEGKSAFSSWVYRIVANCSFMKLRKRKQDRSMFFEDLAPIVKNEYLQRESQSIERADNITYQNQIKASLEKSIAKLPEEYRRVFILRDVDGLSNVEVGEILGISLAAVKSRLHRARLILRKKLSLSLPEYAEKNLDKLAITI